MSSLPADGAAGGGAAYCGVAGRTARLLGLEIRDLLILLMLCCLGLR